jgi:hypothetical protein
MFPVAKSGGVVIHCPVDGRYAFYNSPYPAHRLMTGIDIYPNSLNDEPMPSPVEGEVLQVRYVKSPQGHGFEAPLFDVVTIIRSNENPGRVIKVLHIDTKARVGESISTGQILGPLIRSGYFGYQTPLHAHIEVRPSTDPLRVRGGYPIDSLLEVKGLDLTEEITGRVTITRPGYALIKLGLKTPGIVANVGGVPGILDGGIPLYGWFGAHAENPILNAHVKLLGKIIGKITGVHPRTCVAECTKFRFMLGFTPVDAFFMLLPSGEPTIAVTSRRRGGLVLNQNSEVSLTVEQLAQ